MGKQFDKLIALYDKGELKTPLDIAIHGYVAIERIQKSLKYNDSKLRKGIQTNILKQLICC